MHDSVDEAVAVVIESVEVGVGMVVVGSDMSVKYHYENWKECASIDTRID